MSFFMVGGELARTIGPILVTAGVSWWGLEGIYRLMPIGIIASLILYVKLKDFDVNRPILSKKKEKGDVKKLLKIHRSFFIALALFMLFQSGMKSALTLYLPVYLVNQGESLWYAGISLALLQLFGVIGTFISGTISDKIGRKETLLIATIGSTAFMAIFIYTGDIVSLGLLGLFLFATSPVLMALVQDRDSHMPTFMNSLYMSINFGVSSLVVFAVGFLGDTQGLATTFLIFNVIALGMIPMVFLLEKKRN